MATTLPEIPLTKLTTGAFDGTGVADKLMQSVHSYIEHEFKAGRLKGPEYAQVCLGLIQTAMQTGTTFLLQQQKAALDAQLVEAQIRLVEAQILVQDKELEKLDKEILVLVAQECLLRAQYDATMATVTKTGKETDLLTQKVETERAQTQSTGVSADSVIGRQKDLYVAQASGFQRDAEQKAVKIMVDTWNVRRTTDEATSANSTNKLDDASVGAAVAKLLAGINA